MDAKTEQLEAFAFSRDRDEVLRRMGGPPAQRYELLLRHLMNQGPLRVEELRTTLEEAKKVLSSPERRKLDGFQLAHRFLAASDAGDEAAFKALLDELRNKIDVTIPAPPREAVAGASSERGGAAGHSTAPSALSSAFPEVEAVLSKKVKELNEEGCVRALERELSLSESERDMQRVLGLIQNLSCADAPVVVDAVLLLLQEEDSRGQWRRGLSKIHLRHQLSEEQLVEMGDRLPSLRESDTYVRERLRRMLPAEHVDLGQDEGAHEAYLTRVHDFAGTLGPKFAHLTLFALHHRLAAAVRAGRFDTDLFLRYLAIPRQDSPFRRSAYPGARDRHHFASLGRLPAAELALPPVTSSADAELCVQVMERLAAEVACARDGPGPTGAWGRVEGTPARTMWPRVSAYLQESVVEEVYFRAALHEVQSSEQLNALLAGASAPQRREAEHVEDAVEIAFAPETPSLWTPQDRVELAVRVKNVDELLIKVFEINTTSFYRETGTAIRTNMNLDGLVPSHQRTAACKSHPLHRAVHRFAFPELDARRGIFVVELVGNGKSARGVIRKGQINLVQRDVMEGTAFVVLDEAMTPFPPTRCTLTLGGVEHRPNASGVIVVPPSPPGSAPPKSALVTVAESDDPGAWTVSALERVELAREAYSLDASFFVDRDALVEGNSHATLLVRAQLRNAAGIQVPVSRVEGATLALRTRDSEGNVSSLPEAPVTLSDDEEVVHVFRVPADLRHLECELTGRVRLASTAKTESLSASFSTSLNGLQSDRDWVALYLRRDTSGYHAALRGKGGEAYPGERVIVRARSRMLQPQNRLMDWPSAELASDTAGEVHLGDLDQRAVEVVVEAPDVPGVHSLRYTFPTPRAVLPEQLHLPSRSGADQVMARLPWTGPLPAGDALAPSEASLLVTGKDGAVLHNASSHLRWRPRLRCLDLVGLPDGDYALRLHAAGFRAAIRVGGTRSAHDSLRTMIVQGNRVLELPLHTARVPSVGSVEARGETLRVKLTNATPGTRVHAVCRHFAPTADACESFAPSTRRGLATTSFGTKRSQYVEGRTLSEEYMYILNRQRSTASRAGNTLAKPGLLANRWAVRTTATRSLQAAGGTDFANRAMAGARRMDRARVSTRGGRGGRDSGKGPLAHATRDFLPAPGTVVANLRANEDGVVEVARSDLGPGACDEVTLVVVDRHTCSAAEATLGERQVPPSGFYADRRLQRAIAVDRHVVETKRVTLLQAGEVATVSRGDLKAFDSLSGVAQLLEALARGKGGKEWALLPILLKWGSLTDKEKRAEYERFASHELHLFAYRHDRPFFDACVRPHLETKVQPTAVDDWLLGRDMSAYVTDPSRFAALNAAEKALLVARLPAEQGRRVAAHLRGVADGMEGVDTAFDRAFDTALKLSAMEAGESPIEQRQKEQTDLMEQIGEAIMPPGGDGGSWGFGGQPQARNMMFGMAAGLPPPPPGAAGPRMKKKKQARRAMRRNESDEEEDDDDSESCSSDSDHSASMPPSDSDADSMPAGASGDEWEAAQRTLGTTTTSGRRAYQPMGKTQEWVESNFLLQEKSPASLVPVSGMWAALAEHYLLGDAAPPVFLSRNLLLPSASFTEVALKLAVLSLPAESGSPSPHGMQSTPDGLRVTAGTPLILCHKELAECPLERDRTLVVARHYTEASTGGGRPGRPDEVRLERPDKLLARRPYKVTVVVTNAGTATRRVRVLSQIPAGSVPLGRVKELESSVITVQPYRTADFSYHVYFPEEGAFAHFPAHLSSVDRASAALGCTPAEDLVVSVRHALVDKRNWRDVALTGTNVDVLEFLREHGPDAPGVDLGLIRWRLGEADFLRALTDLLRERMHFAPKLWSAAVLHGDRALVAEWVCMEPRVTGALPPAVPSALLPGPCRDAAAGFELREYDPIVNERAFQLGRERKVANADVEQQYRRLLRVMACSEEAGPDLWVAAAYYLVLQDRVEEAAAAFDRACLPRTNPADAPQPRPGLSGEVQFDYLAVYLAFFLLGGAEVPRYVEVIARSYAEYPVLAWRRRFAEVGTQLAEARGAQGGIVVAEDSRDQRQDQLAFQQPSVALRREGGALMLHARNVERVTLQYFCVDVEHLFSSSPFMATGERSHFASVRPNASEVVEVEGEAGQDGSHSQRVPVPESLRRQNVVVEAKAQGSRAFETIFVNNLSVHTIAPFGQLKVTDLATNRPLPRVYVKAYAKTGRGKASFYKDGFTDVRGRFDYASLSTDRLDEVERFAILVTNDEYGSTVVEVAPPHLA